MGNACCSCWQHEGPSKQANGGTCCCLCCAPRSGPTDEHGRPVGKWLPENPWSQEAMINRHRVFMMAIFSPMTALGQLYHNVRADRRNPSSHSCCATPFCTVAFGPAVLLWLGGLSLIIIGMTQWEVHCSWGFCWSEWAGQGYAIPGVLIFFLLWLGFKCVGRGSRRHHLISSLPHPCVSPPCFPDSLTPSATRLLSPTRLRSSIAMIVRVQIRKRDRIPERFTGAYDSACCMQNNCESCSCCEDWMATFGNPLLVLELGRMLMHVVHASKHERYVECSPFGTHYDPDVEAAMPLNMHLNIQEAAMPMNNAYAGVPVTNTHRLRAVPTGTTLEMTPVAPDVVAPRDVV